MEGVRIGGVMEGVRIGRVMESSRTQGQDSKGEEKNVGTPKNVSLALFVIS